MLFKQFFDEIFFKNFCLNSESNTTMLWGPYKCYPPPPFPTGGPNFGDVLIRHCPTRYKKHAENITNYLQCLIRLNGKDAAVLGKQVLMFDEKKFENIRSIIKSLLCSRPPCKPFTPPSLRTSAIKCERLLGLGRF